MFKGILIEDKKYYKLRYKPLLNIVLPSIAIAILVNFYKMPLWVTFAAGALYIATFILMSKDIKAMDKMAHRQIWINESEILLKEKNGKLIKSIKINPADKIKIKAGFDDQSMVDEATGNFAKHFIVLKKVAKEHRFDFEIPSGYMWKQLTKVVDQWQSNKISVDHIRS